jgi:hypothetical protein
MVNIIRGITRIKPGDQHALDGIVENPVAGRFLEPFLSEHL